MKQSSTSNRRKAKSNGSASGKKTAGNQTSGARAKNDQKDSSSSSRKESGGASSLRSGNTSSQKGQDSRSSQNNKENRSNGSNAALSRTGGANSSDGKSAGSSQSGSGFQGSSHLEKFFLDQLKDIYYAEQKITQSLPKMQEAATTEELKNAFEDHLRQTQRHVKRLEKVFETIGKKAEGKKCEAIEGISREVESIIDETEEGTMTRDAALIMAAQKVEHYEIATYGGLVQLAITMQLHDAADILDKTLMEEEDTDALLTEIAENEINLRAEHEGSQGDQTQGQEDQYSQGDEEEESEDQSDDEETDETGADDETDFAK